MKTVGVVTSARADYGIYVPVLRAIEAAPDLQLRMFVTGMHLSEKYGYTVRDIERDGFPIAERIEMLESADDAAGIGRSIGRGVIGFSDAYSRSRPDILMLLGDRFEMLAAASASLPFNIPIAHLHGGESTEGLIDEAIRHSITKMSHLHFVSTEAYARRVIQMGENPERVVVSGAPGLDNVRQLQLMTPAELEAQKNLKLQQPFLLVTYHPVTLESDQTIAHLDELFAALEATTENILFTYPNADTDSRHIIDRIGKFVAKNPRAQIAVSLGTRAYFSVMAMASAMVGNSSSGIIEAASFKLPVVNIGNRQLGRVTSGNVIHVDTNRQAILSGLEQARRMDRSGMRNVYGDGYAAGRIVERIQATELGPKLLIKHFHSPA